MNERRGNRIHYSIRPTLDRSNGICPSLATSSIDAYVRCRHSSPEVRCSLIHPEPTDRTVNCIFFKQPAIVFETKRNQKKRKERMRERDRQKAFLNSDRPTDRSKQTNDGGIKAFEKRKSKPAKRSQKPKNPSVRSVEARKVEQRNNTKCY